jgi:hypothetical protein
MAVKFLTVRLKDKRIFLCIFNSCQNGNFEFYEYYCTCKISINNKLLIHG